MIDGWRDEDAELLRLLRRSGEEAGWSRDGYVRPFLAWVLGGVTGWLSWLVTLAGGGLGRLCVEATEEMLINR